MILENYPLLMTINQAAEMAQKSYKSIQRLCRRGVIGSKVGKEYRIYRDDMINLCRPKGRKIR